MSTAPANGTSPGWASDLANDLARLSREASRPEVEPAAPDSPAEVPGGLAALRELLGETKALRQAVERLARVQERLARVQMAGVPVLLTGDDLAECLALARREIDRLRSVGEIPSPDLTLGRSPRWMPATVCQAIDRMSNGGRR